MHNMHYDVFHISIDINAIAGTCKVLQLCMQYDALLKIEMQINAKL